MIKATTKLIPAAAYIRMSSDQQEASPAQQRAEVVKLAAKHGCALVGEYLDEAISGNETTKRKSFVRMIEDARTGKFKTILCWDQDRFGRFDSIDAGEWIAPLRRAGVNLITGSQGKIDWTSFAGRVIYSIQQEGKNAFLHDLSRNCCRGNAASAKTGRWHGITPFGMDRLIYDDSGALVRRVSFRERFTKPKGWKSVLVPSAEKEAVAAVRWLFATFNAKDCGMGVLVRGMAKLGVKPIRIDRWNRETVVGMLSNAAYVGDAVYGSQRLGKFFQIGDDGDVGPASGAARRRKPPIVVKDAHEGIVARDVFEEAQARIQKRRIGKVKRRSNSFMLSGLLRCGHCGARLSGNQQHVGGCYRYYLCSGAGHHGTCVSRSAKAEVIEGALIDMVHEMLLSGDSLDRLRVELTAQATARAKVGTGAADLQKRLGKLTAQIERGTENLLLADAEDVPAAQAKLKQWRGERAEIEAQIGTRQKAPKGSPAALVEKAMAKAMRLKEQVKASDQAAVREVMGQVFKSVSLFWEPKGKRNWRLTRAVAEFNEDFYRVGESILGFNTSHLYQVFGKTCCSHPDRPTLP